LHGALKRANQCFVSESYEEAKAEFNHAIALLTKMRSLEYAAAGLDLSGAQANIGAELACAVEAAQIAEFGEDEAGGQKGDAVDAAEQSCVPAKRLGLGDAGAHLLFDALDFLLESAAELLLRLAHEDILRAFALPVAHRELEVDELSAMAHEFPQLALSPRQW
jgi:hypothetical protein